jgi:hypothetical protein
MMNISKKRECERQRGVAKGKRHGSVHTLQCSCPSICSSTKRTKSFRRSDAPRNPFFDIGFSTTCSFLAPFFSPSPTIYNKINCLPNCICDLRNDSANSKSPLKRMMFMASFNYFTSTTRLPHFNFLRAIRKAIKHTYLDAYRSNCTVAGHLCELSIFFCSLNSSNF